MSHVSSPGPARGAATSRRAALVWLLALSLVLAACSATTEDAFNSNLPDDATTGDDAATGSAPTDAGCDPDDPTRSLAPLDPLPAPSELPAGSYMAEIRSRGVLRAGVGADTLLFGYLNPQSGDIEGFDVEMARLVAEAIFGDPNRIELVPVTSAERIAAIESGQVDLVVKTMTINCDRWGSINFSSIYYESGQRLLVGSDAAVATIDDLGDEVICAVAGTTSLANLQDRGVATFEASDWTDCLVAFQQGQVSGISTDDTILAGLAAQDPYAAVVGSPFSDEPYGIGLPKEHAEFTSFVNAVLERARADGTWQALYDEWLAQILGSGTPPAAGPTRT